MTKRNDVKVRKLINKDGYFVLDYTFKKKTKRFQIDYNRLRSDMNGAIDSVYSEFDASIPIIE